MGTTPKSSGPGSPPRPRRIWRLAAAVAVLSACFALLAPQPARAEPVPVIVQVPRPEVLPSVTALRNTTVAMVPTTGDPQAVLGKVQEAWIHRVWMVVSYSWICPTSASSCDLSKLTPMLNEARSRGLSVTLHINTAPSWVTGSSDMWQMPKDATQRAHWSSFLTQLATWTKSNYYPVEGYEIWNEENWNLGAGQQRNPAVYADLLHDSWVALKGVDPSNRVIFGGTSRSDPNWVRQIYQHLASTYPGAASNHYFFDLMGVHPYTDTASPDEYRPWADNVSQGDNRMDDNFLAIDRVWAEMQRWEAGTTKTIHSGEFGYSRNGSDFGPVDDPHRAYFLRRAYELAAQRPWMSGLSWFPFSVTAADDVWAQWPLLNYPYSETSMFVELKQMLKDDGDHARPLNYEAKSDGSFRVWMATSGLNVVWLELWVNGTKRAWNNTGAEVFFWPSDAEAGTPLQMQMIAHIGNDQIVDSAIVFARGGLMTGKPRVVKLSQSWVRPGDSVRAMIPIDPENVGAGATATVRIKRNGTVVRTTTLATGSVTAPSSLAIWWTPTEAGTYSVEFLNQAGYDMAVYATVQVG